MAKLSHLILSKSSWGAKQAREQLGLELPKANCNTVEVMTLYSLSLLNNTCNLGLFVDQLKLNVAALNTTFSNVTLTTMLKNTWEQYKDVLKEVPEEHTIAKNLIIEIQKEAKATNGRTIVYSNVLASVILALEKE